ncbi:HEAT repeat domain-containing protein [Candidatus Berkiella cookevillensis]|uniref:HEAT repeat domain-containing protein n=1 Tax=Candidatus Berkiella cookevillensis TaxID=437022 RepID=A0A0Q9YC69_9GAMM|nr:HEAT repeat domain-containing protein [Candidatus Berkiella cookevillensis]MCS5708641.1 HEAT repeat domain-containing protein [Candidatus Berkiella cookevillensis]
MMYFQIIFLLFIFLFQSNVLAAEITNNFEGKWIGVEVMGCDPKTAARVRSIIPINEGELFSSANSDEYKKWCDVIRSEFENNKVTCSFIGYDGGKFYYDVEFIKKNNDYLFREIPKSIRNNVKINSELLDFYNKFDTLYCSKVSSGIFSLENFDKGYLDFDDPELHALAEPLSKLARPNSQNLLDVIEYSNDAELRALAARLLSWSQSPEIVQYIIDREFLNDPNAFVRNDVARTLSIYLEHMAGGALKDIVLEKGVNAFCKQAALPSHADRNKALYSLNAIVSKNPNAINVIDQNCMATLNEIAETSILPNAGGIAKEILKNIDINKA